MAASASDGLTER